MTAETARVQEDSSNLTKYFTVVWCKASKKKHKKWEGDAVLIAKGKSVTLKDMDGKDIGRGKANVECASFPDQHFPSSPPFSSLPRNVYSLGVAANLLISHFCYAILFLLPASCFQLCQWKKQRAGTGPAKQEKKREMVGYSVHSFLVLVLPPGFSAKPMSICCLSICLMSEVNCCHQESLGQTVEAAAAPICH